MTREDIIRMAQEANVYCTTRQPTLDAMLERFAAIVAAAEREACAKTCEKVADDYYTRIGGEHMPYMKATAEDCAMRIRLRGTSMTDKEALKLALEALELANINHWWGSSKIEAAITAIKEALAQPEQEPWCMKMNGCKTKCEDCPDKPPEENT